MRFYGNESLALFKAHTTKGRVGIDEDAILEALGPNTVVVHDHVTMNYNDDFHFKNAECSQHLERDIQKIIDITRHSWSIKLKVLIQETIHKRNELVEAGVKEFDTQSVYTFMQEVDKLLELAVAEHRESVGHYYENDEKKLITRIKKYKESHFLWVRNFRVPPTNNLAERSLRGQKVKLKVSGQYQSVTAAKYFADIRSYIETCYRNGIDTYEAITRLTNGNPYSVSELLGEV